MVKFRVTVSVWAPQNTRTWHSNRGKMWRYWLVLHKLQIECHDVACDAVQSTLQQNRYSYKHTTRRHVRHTRFYTTDNLRNLRNLCIMDFWKQHNVVLCCSVVCTEQGRHKTALVRSVTAPCQIRASSSVLTTWCIPNVSSEHVCGPLFIH